MTADRVRAPRAVGFATRDQFFDEDPTPDDSEGLRCDGAHAGPTHG